jgi:hypothetical protein
VVNHLNYVLSVLYIVVNRRGSTSGGSKENRSLRLGRCPAAAFPCPPASAPKIAKLFFEQKQKTENKKQKNKNRKQISLADKSPKPDPPPLQTFYRN